MFLLEDEAELEDMTLQEKTTISLFTLHKF